ncbi:MAG: hypothetical protein EBV86_18025 [Marivivens sp.]|nr:hypothetical protein [Marivivens sp.]
MRHVDLDQLGGAVKIDDLEGFHTAGLLEVNGFFHSLKDQILLANMCVGVDYRTVTERKSGTTCPKGQVQNATVTCLLSGVKTKNRRAR